VARLREENGLQPGLAVVLVGEDPASKVYVKNKHASTVEVGMASFEHRWDATISEADLLALIDQLNADPKVHGILVQLPLPGHLNSELVINRIDPAKDVDGFDGALHALGVPDDAAGSPWQAGGVERGCGGAVEYRRQADGATAARRQLHGDDRA